MLYEPGDLMSVDVIRRGFGQYPGDPETLELNQSPFVDNAVLMVDSFVVGPHCFSFQPGSVNG